MSKNEMQVAQPQQKLTFSAYMTSTGVKNKINQTARQKNFII